MCLLFGSFDGQSVGAASVPRQQLLGFTRLIGIHEGETRDVNFTVLRNALALVAPSGGLPVVSSGTWTLWLGGGPPSNAQYGGSDVLQGSITVF